MKMAHAEVLKVLPLLAPQDITTSATGSSYIDLDQCVGLLELELMVGALTATDSTDGVVVTVEATTAGASSDTNTAIAYQYMLSSAVDTDSMGAITAATSSGVALTSGSDDSKVMLIYVDPAAMAATVTDGRYVRVYLTPTSDQSATLVGVVARYTPRYSQASQKSST